MSLVAAICGDLGLALNPRKSRIMHQGGRQKLTGLIVNRHINVPRADYDRLKAQLWNCLRHGAALVSRSRQACGPSSLSRPLRRRVTIRITVIDPCVRKVRRTAPCPEPCPAPP